MTCIQFVHTLHDMSAFVYLYVFDHSLGGTYAFSPNYRSKLVSFVKKSWHIRDNRPFTILIVLYIFGDWTFVHNDLVEARIGKVILNEKCSLLKKQKSKKYLHSARTSIWRAIFSFSKFYPMTNYDRIIIPPLGTWEG